VPRLGAEYRRSERMVHERPLARLLVALEEWEIDDPVEDVGLGDEPEFARELEPEQTEHLLDDLLLVGDEERRLAFGDAERCEFRFREELRDLGEHREPLRSPLLREALEPLVLGTGER